MGVQAEDPAWDEVQKEDLGRNEKTQAELRAGMG